MMPRALSWLTLSLLGGGMAACTSGLSPLNNNADTFAAPVQGDDGVVVAESSLVKGISAGATLTGSTDDCEGPGVGVTVGSTTKDDRYLFDKTGENCTAAEVLFNGANGVGSRAADPTIRLSFHDTTAPAENNLPMDTTLPPIKSKAKSVSQLDMPKILNIEPAAGPVPAKATATKPVQMPDPLVAALSQWKTQDTVTANRSAEADAAASRTLDKLTAAQQDKQAAEALSVLSAKLREKERLLEEERLRQDETLKRAAENRAMTESAKQAWQQKENELQAELAATRQRLGQYQDLSSKLAAEKARKEAGYQEKIKTLSGDLQAAEAQADASRRELVLKAAAKIAEAEQLAHAAQLQEQDIRLREAARLKAEAETALDRALALKTGTSVTTDAPAPVKAPLALMSTPVVIHAKDLSLKQLLELVLKQAEPQAGTWSADWQLSGKNQYILKEKWSLTAEAPVQDVLAQIKAQTQKDHKILLTFTQFSQSRLLVVTDGE